MTDSCQSFGQDVEQPTPYKLMGMQGHNGGFPRGTGGPVDDYLALFIITDEALGGEGAALDVAGEVAQCRATAAGVLELNVPGFGG